MPKFRVRIAFDEDTVIEADNEEDAIDKFAEQVINEGLWWSESHEVDDDEEEIDE